MSGELNGFTRRYAAALQDYLAQGGEGQLHAGYELGREALNGRIGLLDLVDAHNRSVTAALEEDRAASTGASDGIRAAGRFFMEVLSPFEMLHRSHQEANAALRRLNEILEEEAKRIAHALHDEAGQLLATVYLELAELHRVAPGPVRVHAERISAHLDEVRDQLRRLSHELRPLILDELGIVPALEFLAAGFRRRAGLVVTVRPSVAGRFDPAVEAVIYRAAQEGLTNVVKHAGATRVDIRLWTASGMLRCAIRDDGEGFDSDPLGSPPRGLGLIGIQERVRVLNGTISVTAVSGGGTELCVAIPERR